MTMLDYLLVVPPKPVLVYVVEELEDADELDEPRPPPQLDLPGLG